MSHATELLSESGPVAAELARALGGFEIRPQQIEMAAAVTRAMEAGERLVVEAGTGVGKSFAYLVPAIMRATRRAETVVVATATIALQEQLIGKDIPLLVRALGLEPREPAGGTDDGKPREAHATPSQPLRAVLAKGRGNYMSIRRLEMASRRALHLLHDEPQRRTLHSIEDWAAGTLEGSLASAPALERPEVWDHVRSDTDNCMGRKCRHFKECFYQKARRELESANLIVCNHALFFSDLALRVRGTGAPGTGGAILPNYHHVILDEAHGVEDAASEHFGLSLTEARVMRLLRTLFSARRRKGYLLERALAAADTETVDKAISLVQRCEQACRVLFDTLLEHARRNRSSSGRLRQPAMELGIDNRLSPALSELALCLRRLRDSCRNEEDRFELSSFARRAADLGDSAEAMLEQTLGQPGDYAYWVEVEGGPDLADGDDAAAAGDAHGQRSRRFTRVTLACAPVDVSTLLRKHLFSRESEGEAGTSREQKRDVDPSSSDSSAGRTGTLRSIVLTSATLATRRIRGDEHPERAETAFSHLLTNLGIDEPCVRTVQLGSPFDYARQARVIVDLGVPDPKHVGSGGRAAEQPDVYIRTLATRIRHHVAATHGGAFVLFTSFAAMNAVADLLASDFADDGLTLLVQGRDGPRTLILRRFVEIEKDQSASADATRGGAVLFGAASFWQGVDVRGNDLRNVIITRLPFEPPDRPLTQARNERIEAAGGNPFMQDSLPRAILRFKQGFGRLIRSGTDTGRVVVLDPRVRTARYGRRFLDALPEGIPVAFVHEHSTEE